MNRGSIVKSLAVAVGLYSAAGFWGLPYLLKNSVPQSVLETSKGGKFSVESVSFNPFTFHLIMNKIEFKTPDEGNFIAMERFSINLDPLSYVWRGGWVIGDITLTKPTVSLHRDKEGNFNFKWLTLLGNTEEEKQDSDTASPKLLIERFALEEGKLDYRDWSEGKSYALDAGPIGFSVENIDLRNLSASEGMIRLYATINEGGFIDLRGKIDALSPLAIGGNIAFSSGKLYTPWRYFKEKFPIEVADGEAKFGFDYRFNSNDINATELSNLNVDISKLRIIPKGEDRNMLGMGGLHLREGRVYPLRQSFNAESLRISGLNIAAVRSSEGKIDWIEYLEQIQRAFPKDENETKVPWTFRIGSIGIEKVGLDWIDYAPSEPYRLHLTNGHIHTGPMMSDEKSLLDLDAATDDISLIRQKDGVRVAGIGSFGIDGLVLNRAGHFADIAKVSIQKPEIFVRRLKNGSIDLSNYIYNSGEKSDSNPSTPWGYRLNHLTVSDGKIGWRDAVPRKNVEVNFDQFILNVDGFSNNPREKNKIAFSSRMNERGWIRSDGEIVRTPMQSNGTFSIKEVDLGVFNPYLEPSTYASLQRGVLSMAGNYTLTPSKTLIKGKVALSDWVINDSRDNSVLVGWQGIGATPFVYGYPDNRLKINHLAVDGFYINALIDEKKILNFSTLSKTVSEANTTKSSGKEFGIDIVKFLVRGSSATFSDLSLPLPFKTYIHDLEGSVLGISTTKDMMTFAKLRGEVDQYGLAKIDGQLNTKDPKKFTDLKVTFDNLELQQYTPYSLQFLGYKIAGGRLFLNLGYKIDNGNLKGANKVVIKQIALGDEKEGGSPWPMRLVVALLEDNDRVIDIDLPVEGDVNNPDFKYGKALWHVVGNLFTKAVTSPFQLLGTMMGVQGDELSAIKFEGGSSSLLAPQKESLDKVAAILTKRPKLLLEVYGASDGVSDPYALKGQKLILAAMKQEKGVKIDSVQAIPVELLETMAKESLDRGELKTLRIAMEEKYPEESAFVRYYSTELIERLIAIQTVHPQELEQLAQKRSEQIRLYLLKNPDLAKRIVIKGNETAKRGKEAEVPVRLNMTVL